MRTIPCPYAFAFTIAIIFTCGATSERTIVKLLSRFGIDISARVGRLQYAGCVNIMVYYSTFNVQCSMFNV